MDYEYLFGPVPSRRLGISLGVDLIPYKTCSLNCVYCEIGRTTDLKIKRKEYIKIDKIIEELNTYLKSNPELDFITFSGQGEPTLNSGMEKVIDFLKDNYPEYRIAVITNSTLIHRENVRKCLKKCNVILPSLDSATKKSFQKINRPHSNLNINKIIEGLIKFSKDFNGKIWLEIFIIPGINNSYTELKALKKHIIKIDPDIIQLNTLDRPPAESWVKKASLKNLEDIKDFFKPLKTEIIAKYKRRSQITSFNKNISKQIINTVQRRPCTIQELKEILNIHKNELNKYLGSLVEDGILEKDKRERGTFYKLKT